MLETSEGVFTWLTEKTGSGTFYLELLHGSKGHQPKSTSIFRECALLLIPYPETTQSLILQGLGGWRGHLVSNMIAILQNTPRFETDLASSLIGSSWVAPQLAAGIALTTQGPAISLLEAFLELAIEDRAFPKSILSAYAALKLLNRQVAHDFEHTSRFADLKTADRDDCIELAYHYYESDLWQPEASGM